MSHGFWIILANFLVAANAGLLGNFLILRKQAMVGDAISHAVLPGIAIAFLVSNTTHPFVLFLGAALAGIGATLLISFFERSIGIAADTAIGITFTTFFSLGVVLVSLYTEKVDLDQQCVLYGDPVLIPFDVWIHDGRVMGPKAIYFLGVLLLINVLCLGMCYRAWVWVSFDPHFADVMGLRTTYWHHGIMLLTALTTVAAFKVVGAILVVALLVVPSATAYLLCDGLKPMLLSTLVLDVWIAFLGYYVAMWLNASMAGAMVSVAGLFFVLALGISARERRHT